MLFASSNWRGLARTMPSLANMMPSVEPSGAELISEVVVGHLPVRRLTFLSDARVWELIR
jgi:hypothetical protein